MPFTRNVLKWFNYNLKGVSKLCQPWIFVSRTNIIQSTRSDIDLWVVASISEQMTKYEILMTTHGVFALKNKRFTVTRKNSISSANMFLGHNKSGINLKASIKSLQNLCASLSLHDVFFSFKIVVLFWDALNTIWLKGRVWE